MTYLLIPPALAAAALGLSFGLSRPGQPSPPTVLPAMALVSAPIGGEAVPGRTFAHPIMPVRDRDRSVRVVLASPFPTR